VFIDKLKGAYMNDRYFTLIAAAQGGRYLAQITAGNPAAKQFWLERARLKLDQARALRRNTSLQVM